MASIGDQDKKDANERVKECIQIKTQLQQIGAFINDRNRSFITRAMNMFVVDGVPAQFKLRIDDKVNAIVALKAKPMTKSGIILEKL